jgi:hypothetical protein
MAGDSSGLRIEDDKGQDQTASATDPGLPPGGYHLKGSRPGFAPLDVPFTLTAGETEHEVPAPVWKALPVQIVIHSTLAGQATLDGQPLNANGTDLSGVAENGTHHLEWSGAGFAAKLYFESSDGAITKTAWTVNPRFGATFASVDLKQVSYDAVNVGNKVLVNDVAAPVSGTLELPPDGQPTSVKASTGTKPMLAELQRTGAEYSGAIILNLLPPVGASRPRGKTLTTSEAPAAPAGPQTTQVAPVTPAPQPTPAAITEPAAPKGETAADRLRRRAGATKEK